MFGNILERTVIQNELKVVMPHILRIFKKEIEQIESSVMKVLLEFEFVGLLAVPLDDNFSPVSGALMWIERFLQRTDMYRSSKFTGFILLLL